MESPTSSASASSSADVSTSAERQRFVCFMDMRRRRYAARGLVEGCEARVRYVLVDTVDVGVVLVVSGIAAGQSSSRALKTRTHVNAGQQTGDLYFRRGRDVDIEPCRCREGKWREEGQLTAEHAVQALRLCGLCSCASYCRAWRVLVGVTTGATGAREAVVVAVWKQRWR